MPTKSRNGPARRRLQRPISNSYPSPSAAVNVDETVLGIFIRYVAPIIRVTSVNYGFLLPLAAAFAKFCFTLSFTIRSIKLKGIGY